MLHVLQAVTTSILRLAMQYLVVDSFGSTQMDSRQMLGSRGSLNSLPSIEQEALKEIGVLVSAADERDVDGVPP